MSPIKEIDEILNKQLQLIWNTVQHLDGIASVHMKWRNILLLNN